MFLHLLPQSAVELPHLRELFSNSGNHGTGLSGIVETDGRAKEGVLKVELEDRSSAIGGRSRISLELTES